MKTNNIPHHTIKLTAQAFLAIIGLLMVNMAFAQAGGLDRATDTMDEIKDWAYRILGVGVFLYLIYNVIMALLDRKQWADVLISVGYVALAGAVLVIADWAWALWGS